MTVRKDKLVCYRCGSDGPFPPSRYLRGCTSSLCNPCNNEVRREKTRVRNLNKVVIVPTTRVCTKCGIEKDLKTCFYVKNAYYKGKRYEGKYLSLCRVCSNLKSREWRKANPEKDAKIHARYSKTPKGRASQKRATVKCEPKRKAWQINNREKCRAYSANYKSKLSPERRKEVKKYQLRHDLFKLYGITQEDYDALLEKQHGVCAICHKPSKPGGKRSASRLHVDHDHETGRVRGLLCNRCNLGIGHLHDSPVLLLSALKYLNGTPDSIESIQDVSLAQLQQDRYEFMM